MVIAIVIVVILVLYILIVYNKLVKGRLKVQQAKSSIDVYLQQRFDLIPNLVECVKQYSKYEKETFTEITNLRASYTENKDLETGRKLNNSLNNLIAVAEAYPELKADEQFLNLQKNLAKMEDQLQAARRLYNIDVTSINGLIQSFPSNLIANMFEFKAEQLFELEDVSIANNIKL